MANFLGLPMPITVADEVLIDGLLVAACKFYIDYTSKELLIRNYTLRYDRYPERQAGYGGLGGMHSSQDWWIPFSVWPVDNIASVTVNLEALVDGTDYTYDLNSEPARLMLAQTLAPNIIVNYNAGYATSSEIPANALTGIQLLTAYLFDHRGACDVSMAAQQSGAKTMWASDVMILTL
jgi:hypothetical protein